MFEWLRNKVKNAILAGVNDAMETLQGQASTVPDGQDRLLEENVKFLPDRSGKVDKSRR